MSVLEMRHSRHTLFDEARRINEQSQPGGEARGRIERIWNLVDAGDARSERARKRSVWEQCERDTEKERDEVRASADYRRKYDKYFRRGPEALEPNEARALAAENNVLGGYLVPPVQLTESIVKFIDNALHIRTLATRLTLSGAQSLGAPSVDVDPDDSTWTSELATGDEDSAMRFGRRELFPWPVAKRVKASNKVLLRARNATSLVAQRLAYKLSVTAERAYLNGDGDKKPLGLFTASTSGISTARDVSSGNSSTSIGIDGLHNAMFSLKQGYLSSPSLRWVFHRDGAKQVRLLKDSAADRYLLEPAAQAGHPDKLLGVEVLLSEYCPATFTTGLYVGLIGALDFYWIADAEGVMIQRLSELYGLTDQTGFIGRLETDGTPVLEEAFARVKLA